MAILKTEKLSAEELEQVNGGLIKIEDGAWTDISSGATYGQTEYATFYWVCNDRTGKHVGLCLTLEEAIRKAKANGYSTEVIDTRQQQE